MTAYDDEITVVPKPTTPVFTVVEKPEQSTSRVIIPKPYSLEPNALLAQDGEAILNEDGTTLLLEVG